MSGEEQQYEQYPLWLQHPGFQGAVLSTDGNLGSPLKFPPVLVYDDNQRAEYEAKGYEAKGVPDPKSFIKARSVEELPPDYDPNDNEYPKYVLGQIVNTRAQEEALRGFEKAVETCEEVKRNDVPAPVEAAPAKRKSREWTPEQRQAMSEKMKAKRAEKAVDHIT